MESFAKFADESMKRVNFKELNGGFNDVVPNNDLTTAYLDAVYPAAESIVEGGLDISGPLPVVQEIDFEELADVADGYMYNLSTFTRYMLSLGVFLLFYWLVAPGQLLQLYNSKKSCNSQVFGKDTLGTTYNPSVTYTFKQCQGVVDAGVPLTATANYTTSHWYQCNQLMMCNAKFKWGGYFISSKSIVIHGLVLGIVLSFLPLIRKYTYLDSLLTPALDMIAYFFGMLIYVFVGLPLSLVYDSSYGSSFYPSYDKISQFSTTPYVPMANNPFSE